MTDLTNHPDGAPLDPWTLESLLDGDVSAIDDVTAPLADLIASARRPGDAVELRGAADALAAFRAVQVEERVATPTRRTSMITTMTRSKLVVAATAGALTLGAASAAAYSNVLPDSVQSAAHQLINAPAPHGHAVGPDATGPAAKGLCTAYASHQAEGTTINPKSVAFRNLAAAAGGEENIATYCASLQTPTATASPTESTTASETAEPTTEPTGPVAKGQGTANPGQGAAQWTSHSRTATFPGQGASHWPKATGQPGKGHQPTSTTAPTTAPTTPTETETAAS